MPCPRFYGCILRKAVDQLSWPLNSNWQELTREQQGELTKEQVGKLQTTLKNAPLYAEHPEEGKRVKVGEVLDSYITDDDAWYVLYEINDSDTAGQAALRMVRRGVLPGLSLSHDTVDLTSQEVSLVKEGFRLQTGTEGELSSHVLNNESEYKQNTDANTTSQPRVIEASLHANKMNQSMGTDAAGAAILASMNQSPSPISPPPQAQTQSHSRSSAPPSQSARSPAITDVIQSVLGSNAPPDAKKFLMQHIQEMDAKHKQLAAENHNLKNSNKRGRMLFDQVVSNIAGQLGEKLELLPVDDKGNEVEPTSKDGAVTDVYDRNMPKILSASYRLIEVMAGHPLRQQHQQQHQQQQNHYERAEQVDPELSAQYNMFKEAMGGNVGLGSYGAPRYMTASNNNKKQRTDSAGWYDGTELPAGFRQMLRETQPAATGGFGDVIRGKDVYSNGVGRGSRLPDETNA